MLSRLVIAFLPRRKCLLISWLQSPSAVILEPPKIKFVTVSTVSPSICHEVMGWDAMILVFWMLSFKPAFSLSSFTFIKRLFSSSLSTIRVVSSAYLRLLILLLKILIPACASSSLAFSMMYSAYKLNKQGDNIQPWHDLEPVFVPCPVLTVASWPATDFSRGRPGGPVFPSLQLYVNQVLPDVQAGFRKGRGTRDQIANIHCIIEKAREFRKNIYFCFIDYAKAMDCVDHNKLCGKFLKIWGYQTTLPASWETYL